MSVDNASVVNDNMSLFATVSVTQCFVHGIFCISVILLCLVCRTVHNESQRQVMFGQHGRAVFTLCLICIQLLVAIEGILSAVRPCGQVLVTVHCAHGLAVAGAMLSLVLCEVVTVNKLVGVVLWLYWLAGVVVQLLLVINYTATVLPLLSARGDVRFLLSLIYLLVYISLFLLQSYSFIHKVCYFFLLQ